ncbi:chromosome segregation protein SMC [Paenibacillus cymbidii]|uniref:chromosome segregation protein SMC n=1 Tax=Paenibacillus cymbidii TaxID=1639034 RepID=UPI001081D8DC|nr:chromosome segregation protein SMC [Paenibacillus cymbidii]
MFLKRIELAGFKSFADRTELEFVKGITAVVGPNGSGKSNISDGIRWVLGEQSAKSLRGGNMQDVIFAGSDARKPVNFGEVSLTLDNTSQSLPLDFHEVTVTRRVHRSGESEYFINKQACRLKDITELFMDTGIGKEAYSIIGQGRIEEILSTKSEDRRGIFEEASGIVKYKSRKKEAEKRLAETEQNLLRIHDLVSELEDQVEPLREQADKAHRFKELKEQLKRVEISMYVHQIEQFHRQWTDATTLSETQKQRQLELATIVGQHDAQLETHRWETRRLEDELEKLQQLLLTFSEEFEKCEGLGEVLKERSRNTTANIAQLETTIAAQRKRVADKENDREAFIGKMAAVAEQLAAFERELRAEEERLLGVSGGISAEAEERLRGDLLETLSKMAQSRNEIRYAEQQLETLQRRGERVRDEHIKWDEQRDKLEKRKVELDRKLKQAARDIEQVREAYIALSAKAKDKQALLEDTSAAVRRWEQKLEATVSRRDTMKDLQNDYEGFQFGVREVLKAKNRADGLRGIHGAVAELIQVPAEVETALETALGGALQHVVVENEADGRAAIAFLKKRQLGRATFLPLDVIRGRSLSESERRSVSSAEGFVGVAVDLIRFDSRYRDIAGSLLGNVIVAKTLEDANRIAAKCQYRYRVVTLEGDIVNAGGSMTGGSQTKKSANLLGRQRQIEELDKEIASSKQQLGELRKTLAALKEELIAIQAKQEELRQEGERKRIEEQQYAASLAPLESEMNTMREQLELASQDGDELKREAEALAAKKAAAAETLERLAAEEKEQQRAIRAAENARKASEAARDELQEQLTGLKVKIAAAAQEKASLAEQQERFRAEHGVLVEELTASERLYAQLEREAAANERDTVKQIEQLNDLKLKKASCAEQTELKRAERAQWVRKLEEEENETREQRVALKAVEEALHQTEVRLGRLDVELDNVLRKLGEEYELSFELAKERYPVPEDVPAAQASVRELRREIASLGSVNLGAIEEFARVSERFEFLSTQKQDLLEAKASLYQVIREMDDEMSRRFKTTFDAIRSHFVVVFAKLFGGGRADLIMSEPDIPLETGIDIVAQPPGKKLQNLQLLSGGERALTAIALLFAILLVKPVPFCVLDEVEAALDEANVSRFAEYLREFSHQTQFIVVTHRKGTMEEADVLYGVTMEEGGVSKLVSVRLDEAEENEPVSA